MEMNDYDESKFGIYRHFDTQRDFSSTDTEGSQKKLSVVESAKFNVFCFSSTFPVLMRRFETFVKVLSLGNVSERFFCFETISTSCFCQIRFESFPTT